MQDDSYVKHKIGNLYIFHYNDYPKISKLMAFNGEYLTYLYPSNSRWFVKIPRIIYAMFGGRPDQERVNSWYEKLLVRLGINLYYRERCHCNDWIDF